MVVVQAKSMQKWHFWAKNLFQKNFPARDAFQMGPLVGLSNIQNAPDIRVNEKESAEIKILGDDCMKTAG